jgi:hypothetical protein
MFERLTEESEAAEAEDVEKLVLTHTLKHTQGRAGQFAHDLSHPSLSAQHRSRTATS